VVTTDTNHTAASTRDSAALNIAGSVWAGFVGTAAMTLTMWLEKHSRRRLRGPVDYDASAHVVAAASNLLRITPRQAWQRRGLFLAVHWGYGSLVGVLYREIRRRVPNDAVAVSIFYAACQTMAFVLFPTLGETPPPWRWRKDMLVSSLVQHAVYAGVVAAVSLPGRGTDRSL
jgi:hypothetical protein